MDDDTVGLIHLATHALHLMAGAAWIGGLLPLGLLIHRARRSASDDDIRYAIRCLARFSSAGVAAIVIVTLTGITNLVLLTGNLQGVLASDWGRVLMMKLALFVAMVVLAAINRLRWLPALSSPGSTAKAIAALAMVLRNVVAEQALGWTIIAAADRLGTLSPFIG